MNAVTSQMEELANIEYEAAKADHRPLSSMHEGYAILLEELEETREALQGVENQVKGMWIAIKHDDTHTACRAAEIAAERAKHTACEAIQVAAVCQRFMDILK